MADFTIHNVIDQHLLHKCIAGHRKSQFFLYNYFAPKMLGICIRYANDFHHAEDILQEGFIKVFNNLHRYRHQGSFEGWLKRIFINTAIEHYRKAKTQYRFQELEKANYRAVDPEALHYLSHEELLSVIQKLPQGYRTVFNLYVIEGFNHREVAELLNISEGTSKSQLARARATLQAILSKQEQYEKR